MGRMARIGLGTVLCVSAAAASAGVFAATGGFDSLKRFSQVLEIGRAHV